MAHCKTEQDDWLLAHLKYLLFIFNFFFWVSGGYGTPLPTPAVWPRSLLSHRGKVDFSQVRDHAGTHPALLLGVSSVLAMKVGRIQVAPFMESITVDPSQTVCVQPHLSSLSPEHHAHVILSAEVMSPSH